MYCTVQQKYYLSKITDYVPETGTYILDSKYKTKVFNNESELIYFIAKNVNTRGFMDSGRWSCPYFTNQNLSGTDCRKISFEEYISHWDLYYASEIAQYIFYTRKDGEHISLVDIRKYKAEAYKIVYAEMVKLIRNFYYREPYNPWDKTKFGKMKMRHIKHHHHSSRWCTTQRKAKLFDPEYKEFSKPKYRIYTYSYWHDGHCCRDSAGWKHSTKYRHQWEAKAAREYKKIKRRKV